MSSKKKIIFTIRTPRTDKRLKLYKTSDSPRIEDA